MDIKFHAMEIFFLDHKTKYPEIKIAFGGMSVYIEQSLLKQKMSMKSDTFDIEYYIYNEEFNNVLIERGLMGQLHKPREIALE